MKFQQYLERRIYNRLHELAKQRGIDVQEYIRAVVIPQHLEAFPIIHLPKNSLRVKKGWETRRKKQEDAELQAKNEEFPPYPAGPQT